MKPARRKFIQRGKRSLRCPAQGCRCSREAPQKPADSNCGLNVPRQHPRPSGPAWPAAIFFLGGLKSPPAILSPSQPTLKKSHTGMKQTLVRCLNANGTQMGSAGAILGGLVESVPHSPSCCISRSRFPCSTEETAKDSKIHSVNVLQVVFFLLHL